MEYQVANALAKNGHEVLLFGIHDDLHDMSARLGEWKPDLVFNATEAFLENSNLDYLVPALLEAEGYRYTGAPPLALLVTRNKSMSKKVLAYHGIKVPELQVVSRRRDSDRRATNLRFPVIVKPLAADASEGISQASIVHDQSALTERVAWVHERFEQPAIAEEYIEGRELYATMIGNGDKVEVLPIVEMVFEQAGLAPRGPHRDAEVEVGHGAIASGAGSRTCSHGRWRRPRRAPARRPATSRTARSGCATTRASTFA